MLSARLVVAAAIGAALAVVLGYIVYAAAGDVAYSFHRWVVRPQFWWPWPIFGALVGAGLTFVVQRR